MITKILKAMFFPVLPLYGGVGKGGGDTKSTQTTNSEPWKKQQPYLEELFKGAQSLYRTGGPEVWQGDRVAGFGTLTQDSLARIQDRAAQGSDLNRAGSDLTLQTIRGDFLNSNPYLDTMYDNAAGAVTRNYREAIAPTVDSSFSMAGRYGSGAHMTALNQAQDQLGRTLGNLSGEIYGRNYQAERANQMNAVPLGAQMAENDYNDMARQLTVGQMYDGMDQAQLDAERQKFMEEQNRQLQNLGNYQALVGGNYGGTTTSTATQSGPSGGLLGNVIGGAMSGMGLAGHLSGAGSGIFGGTPTFAGLGSMGTMGLYGLGGALAGGLLG